METTVRELAQQMFDRVMAKDMPGSLALFAEDAVLFDPHYPNPQMVGKEAILDGLTWGFGSIQTFGFTIERFYPGEDGRSAAVEVATAHVLKGGMKLNFPQAFFFETRDGLITRLQAYEPYGPNGIGGIVLGLARLRRRVTGKR